MDLLRKNGEEIRLTSPVRWLVVACEGYEGRIEVACADAESTTLRNPSREELDANPKLNPYWDHSPDHKGNPVQYLYRFTEEELVQYGIQPEGCRPSTNRSDQVRSAHAQKQHYDWLQNDCLGEPNNY